MKRLILILFLFANLAQISAQTIDISGTVYDESYKPLSGCYIHTSESRYTMSDSLGHYSIPVSTNKDIDIYFEYLGYRKALTSISPERSLFLPDVRMVPDSVVFRPATVMAWDIPLDVEYITLYTQNKTKRGTMDLYPYVIRFQDNTGLPILRKQANKVMKTIKNVPAADIVIGGFELDFIGNMQDDAGYQKASSTVASYGLHDYGTRDTPVYYFKRRKK